MNDSELISQYCEKRDTEFLNNLSSESRKKLIHECAISLFFNIGNKDISFEILEHYKILETFYKANGKNIIRLVKNSVNMTSTLDNLLFKGIATIPIYKPDELDNVLREFNEACVLFPEYKRSTTNVNKNSENQDLLYVLGGFAAFGNPASFHNN